LKALVWQDAEGRTWLAYNDPLWLAARHATGTAERPIVAAMAAALATVAGEATGAA
jgi:uncharacterized protein (DUF302 family)